MKQKRAKELRQQAFEIYKEEPGKYTSHTNCYRNVKRDFNNGLVTGQNPKLKLTKRQERLSRKQKI